MSESQASEFKPKIMAIVCNWCTYAGADNAGNARREYPAGVRLVRVMCSGRIEPLFVVKALQMGADGVIIMGCHPGDCHYQEGNTKARRRYEVLARTFEQFGIEPGRVRLEWVSASEGERFVEVVTGMYETVKALGPFAPPKNALHGAGGTARPPAAVPPGSAPAATAEERVNHV